MVWYVMVWTLNSPFLILWCSFHPTGDLLMDFSCNNSFNPKALFIIFQKLWITVSIQMLFQLCIRNCESWVYSLIALYLSQDFSSSKSTTHSDLKIGKHSFRFIYCLQFIGLHHFFGHTFLILFPLYAFRYTSLFMISNASLYMICCFPQCWYFMMVLQCIEMHKVSFVDRSGWVHIMQFLMFSLFLVILILCFQHLKSA